MTTAFLSGDAAPSGPAPARLRAGTAPLLVSLPHVGTHVPAALRARLSPAALALPDTDWHLEHLYDFAHSELGASVLQATHARCVVDLNRPPDNASLYPGQATTGLCPTEGFDGSAWYAPGAQPSAEEVQERLRLYWWPYHQRLGAELERLRALHGRVVLWDGHSIASVLPRLFEGTLPDFNWGTANGAACAPELAQALLAQSAQAPGKRAVLNGRFQGGHITRHFGRPAAQVHAVQLELAQRTYMNERAPLAYDPAQAAPLQHQLRQWLRTALEFARTGQVPGG